jgi:PhzF family phenazine biosynthesis protein
MGRSRSFSQVDVFTATPYLGNPVAVILDAQGLSTQEMERIARWTNLSETPFVLPARAPEADYRVRIFTPTEELPFAGHPTLGTCHSWLEYGGIPGNSDVIVQECEAGLVRVRPAPLGLAFKAPPLRREGAVDDAIAKEVIRALGVDRDDVVDIAWADNGAHWVAVLLKDAEAVLSLAPSYTWLDIGVAGPLPSGSPEAFEVRAFFP